MLTKSNGGWVKEMYRTRQIKGYNVEQAVEIETYIFCVLF